MSGARWNHDSAQLALLLFAVLAFNPVLWFLLLNSAGWSLALMLAAVLGVLACHSRFDRGLPTVYLVNVMAVTSIFAHAELVTRVKFADYVMEDLYEIRDGYYFNRPDLRTRLTDKEYAADYLTNKDGFRIGYSQQVDVSYGKIDWLFLGDSYTQGAQVQFEELYTTLLYRRFPDRIVANAGISGWGIVEEHRYLQETIARYQPKVVFLQVSSFNDFMKVSPRTPGISDHLMQRSLFVRLLLQDLKYQNPVRLPLGRWAEPFYPDEQSNRRFNVFFKKTSPEKEGDLRAYSAYLGRMAETARTNGARLVLILLPTKEQIHFPYLEEVVTGFAIDPRDLDMQRPNKFMRALTDSLGLELIDVQKDFEASADEPYFDYDEHLNARGHQLLADIVARRLSSTGTASHARILSREYAGDRYPSYSPNGDFMTFHSVIDGQAELFRVDTGFETPSRITFNDVPESHPTVGPGNRLAFTEGDAAAGSTKVVVSDLYGQGRQTITSGREEFGAIPAFSPDGRRIAYAGWTVDQRTHRLTVPQIFIRNLETGTSQALTRGASESWRPVFSPEGHRIAFITKVDSQFDLFLYDAQSRTTRQLSRTRYDEWDPRFSPDGRKLVFAAKAFGNWDLFLIDLETGERRQITRSRGDEWDPAFSLQGDSITYGGEYGIFRGIYRLPTGN